MHEVNHNHNKKNDSNCAYNLYFSETYLLEKARITCQQEVERSYHIFYQMMQKAVPDLKAKCLLSNDIYDYHYVSQGKTSVPSIGKNYHLFWIMHPTTQLGALSKKDIFFYFPI